MDTDKCTELAVMYICPSVEKKRVRLLETPVLVLSAFSDHMDDWGKGLDLCIQAMGAGGYILHYLDNTSV